jgi:bacteriocin biosynthesis cyclodehydratase domain-containing protein
MSDKHSAPVLSRGYTVHDDGVEMCFYRVSRVEGSVVRGVTAEMCRRLLTDLTTDGTIRPASEHAERSGVPEHKWTTLIDELIGREVLVELDGEQAGGEQPVTAPRIVLVGDEMSAKSFTPWAADRARDFVTLPATTDPATAISGFGNADETVVLLLDEQFNVALNRAWNRTCVAAGARLLSIRLRERSVEIGPFVCPGDAACFECYWQRLWSPLVGGGMPAWLPDSGPLGVPTVPGRDDLLLGVAAGYVAHELEKIASGRQVPLTLSAVLDIDLHTASTTRRRVVEAPGCGVCALAGAR